MTFPPLLFCLQSQFDQFNNILHIIAFSLREIILVGFLVYVYKENFFVYFEINIDHAGGTAFPTIPEGETHLADSAGAFHHGTDLRILQQFLLQTAFSSSSSPRFFHFTSKDGSVTNSRVMKHRSFHAYDTL